jgi:predicted dehydrogenase
MKIMIAGLGSIGRRHMRNLLAAGERDLLLYRTGLGTLPDEELGEFPIETDLQAALAHHPQAVIVSNPTSRHLEVAIPCAKAGCHLLIEKPVSSSLEGMQELQSALAETGRQALVGYHFRQHPNLQLLNRLLETGEIGRPLSVRVHWGEYLPGWHPWEDYRLGYSARPDLGGGVVLTLSHPLDYLGWFFGEVEALWAFCATTGNLDILVEDTAVIGLRFRNGVLGSVHLDYNQRPPEHSLEVVGTHGCLRWEAAGGALQVFRQPGSEWQTYPLPENYGRNNLFLDEIQHFLQVCRGEAQPACTLQDGIQALRLALAARASQESAQIIYL